MVVALVMGVLMATAGAPWPASAACGRMETWPATGKITQGAYHIALTLTQSGQTLGGSAFLAGSEAVNAGYTSSGAAGVVAGTLDGDKFDIVVTWPPKRDGSVSRGRYMGTVAENQIINGTGYDLSVGPQRKCGLERHRYFQNAFVGHRRLRQSLRFSCSGAASLQVSAQEMADAAKFPISAGRQPEGGGGIGRRRYCWSGPVRVVAVGL